MILSPLILLCGGASTRMGTPKGLLEVKGQPWILEQLQHFRAAGGTEVIAVLGFHADRYRAVIAKVNDVTVVVNEHPELGQFSSLQTGIIALKQNARGAFCLPIDTPAPHPDVWDVLQKTLLGTINVVIPTWEEKGGHPVLLSQRFIARLATVPLDSPDARLDRQIHQLSAENIARVPVCDKRVVMNINTPTDLASL